MICTLIGLSLLSPVADTIYVSPGRLGDDKNAGTSNAAPLKTIAAALAKNSETIRLMDGEFPAQKWEIKDRKLTLEADVSANPRLKGLTISAEGSEVTLVKIETDGTTEMKGSLDSRLTLNTLRGRGNVTFSRWQQIRANDCRWTRGTVTGDDLGGNQNRRNVVVLSFNRCTVADSPGNGFVVTPTPGTVRWTNCLVARNGGDGIWLRGVSHAEINYCTLAGGKGVALNVEKSSLELANSIIQAPDEKWRKGGGISSEFNLYSGGDPLLYGDSDIVGDPKFGLALAGGDLEKYRPLSTSPALKASDPKNGIGEDLTGQIRRGRPDLGCLQVSR